MTRDRLEFYIVVLGVFRLRFVAAFREHWLLRHESVEGLVHVDVASRALVEGVAVVVDAHLRIVSLNTAIVKSFPLMLVLVLLPKLLKVACVIVFILILLSVRLSFKVSDGSALMLALHQGLAVLRRI